MTKDGANYGRGSSRRFLNYNGSPLFADDSASGIGKSRQPGAGRSQAAGGRGESVGELLQDGKDQESSPLNDDASLAPPPSQQLEIESKLSVAAS